MDHEDDVTFTARCASCGRLLGHVDRDGWVWTGAPARLVNRRRFVMSAPSDGSVPPEMPPAPPDDFRLRAVQLDKYWDPKNVSLWEYPYTCDSDACMETLGADWVTVAKDPTPKFSLMPPGRTLS